MNRSIWAILTVQFIGSLGFSLVIPFLVVLVTDFGGNAVIYGIIGAMYPLFQLIGAPLLGEWSDRIGRRPVLLLSQLGTLAAWLFFLVALAWPIRPVLHVESGLLGSFIITWPLIILAAARILDGITGGNISVAQAYLADVTTNKDRTKMYGRMSVANGLGFVIGPALAGLLGSTQWGSWPPVIAAVLISIIASGVIFWALPESNQQTPAEKPSKKSQPGATPETSTKRLRWWQAWSLPKIGYLASLYLLVMMAFNFFYAGFPVHAIASLGWTVGQMGTYFAFLSLLTVVVQGPILQWMNERITEWRLLMGGGLVLALNFGLLALPFWWAPWVAAFCFALGNGLMWPSLLAIVSKVAGKTYQGVVQGLTTSAGSLAAVVGLIVGGLVYEHIQGLVFVISALLILTVVGFSWPMRHWPKVE